ncbi:ABC transporter substrate-binding protein [Nocardioides yefusunii]|uniref:ABC transporter substrate-binding protein n=1 Tax=Nocardioides yefusunii TaxID=2500546 RepID=A0ABW1QUU6_9ACTN|nr:ABC transporter substrate-binding protein [Nocardioides yefusunii]
MRFASPQRRGVRLAALASVAALALTACGGTESTEKKSAGTPTAGGTITVDLTSEPSHLDPLKFNTLPASALSGLVYSTLYRWTEDGELVNDIATAAPSVSSDGLTVTIPIRDDVTFHDGSPLTAEDVKYTIEQVKNPDNASIWSAGLGPIAKVETPDDTTVVVHLERRHGVLQGMFAHVSIISADTPYVAGDTYAQTMNGSGPYKFVSWKRGQQVELERNEDYFLDDKAYADEIVLRTVKEDATRMVNIAQGNSDVMPMVPFNQIQALEGRGVKVEITESSAHMPTLFPSMKKGRPTADADFRKALAWAIDRGQIVDTVFKGVAEPASTLIATGTQHWNEELGHTYGEDADLAQAKKHLAASGVKAGTKLEVIVRNEPLSISAGTILQANFKALGLDVSLSPQEPAAYFGTLATGDFDLMLLPIDAGLSSGYTPFYEYSAYKSGSGGNYTGFSDAELDELLEAAVSDPADPDAAWAAVQQRELEVVPLIPTVTARYVEATSERLQGHSASSLFSLRDLDSSWVAAD